MKKRDSLTAKKVGYSMKSDNIYGCEMQEDRMKKLIKNGTIVYTRRARDTTIYLSLSKNMHPAAMVAGISIKIISEETLVLLRQAASYCVTLNP